MGAVQAIKYRADIDGLRAIAVLSVLLFHIDFSWLPGGYIGVDIFFVISGFLITRIIGREIENDRFSLSWFYVRRIRRILPAFYTVTVATIIVGAILLLPQDLYDLLSSARNAVFFAANIYFSRDKGYFDISADEKPMLHIWSLSIEEQYYFIWPLFLFLLYIIGHLAFKQTKRLNQPATLIITCGFVIAGFAYAQYILLANPDATKMYFLPQTRFAELMAGSLVALIPPTRNPAILRILAYTGALLLAVGLVTLTKDSIFPGLNALYPCLGSAFLIYSGQTADGRTTILHKVLGWPVMTFIGLLSYSLYLWHWPILAYMRYVHGTYILPWHWIALAVTLTFVLAFLTYRYIERNLKTTAFGFRKAFFGIFLGPAIVISAMTYGLQTTRPVQELSAELQNYGIDVCHGNLDKQCLRGDKTKKPTVLMTGDSHAAMLNSFIDVVGKHEGWAADVITGSSCSPVFGLNEKVLPHWAQEPCSTLKNFVVENYSKYNAVLLASLWEFQLGLQDYKADDDYLSKLEATLREMAQELPVYVFSDVPTLSVHPLRQLRFSSLGLNVEHELSTKHIRANEIVREIVRRIPNVHWIDLSPALMNFEQMSSYQGKPAYFDDNHLNVYGATALGEEFIKSGGRILTTSDNPPHRR